MQEKNIKLYYNRGKKPVMAFTTAYDAAEYLEASKEVDKRYINYIRQNAFYMCIKGAKISIPCETGRYTLKQEG